MPNRLARETSPYLQQHADNPVDWFAWGEDALEKARREDKPILLSIGYSACHWCHVMAHECFEDAEVAAAMNRDFVSVKVDREERPDIDQIYQTAHAILTERSGGWPLTMFLTPDQRPFFGGTYFPKKSHYNLPGFLDLLPHIAGIYRTQRDAIAQQNTSLLAALARTVPSSPASASLLFDPATIDAAVSNHRASFDEDYGGFGDAPKFPHPAELWLCLRRGSETRDADTVRVATFTLEKMAEGGVYDQIGGGFCRYSVDRHWTIPHFEKMLYDNGQLLKLVADCWLVTGNLLFKRVAEETAGWVMREMQSPDGPYYSTLDADSEHEEGKFYVWTPDEVRSLLTPEEFAVVAPHYGLDRPPNFEGKHWNLRVSAPLQSASERAHIALAEGERLLASARAKLLAKREERVRPGRDEKILTSWNGLMIEGMAHAARIFGRDDWLASARAALAFLRDRMWCEDRLLATYKDGRAHLNAYLDDYAFLLAAMLELLQGEWRSEDLGFARDLADALLDKFEDAHTGGFAFTSHDHEELILRPKPGYDNATPSGNGVAAFALQRLGHLVSDARYLTSAERTLRLFQRTMQNQPNAFSTLVAALDENLSPPRVVNLRGSNHEMAQWQRHLALTYRPDTFVLAIPADVSGLPEVLAKPSPPQGVNAWVCVGVSCLPAIADLGELDRLLDGEPKSR